MDILFILTDRPDTMDVSRYLILAALVCAAIAASGCSTAGPSAPAAPASPAPAAAAPLASLALAPADVPQGYVLTESRGKDAAEVGRLAHDLGWQGGYAVTFTNTSAAPAGRTTIAQTITAYPEENVPGVIGIIVRQERSGTALTFSDIPDPGLGNISGGFTGHPQPVSVNENRHPLIPAAAQPEPEQDFSEVYFSKGTLFEVIRMTGPASDPAVVTAIARTAYAKIP